MMFTVRCVILGTRVAEAMQIWLEHTVYKKAYLLKPFNYKNNPKNNTIENTRKDKKMTGTRAAFSCFLKNYNSS